MEIQREFIKRNNNQNIFTFDEGAWEHVAELYKFNYKLSKVNVIIKLSVSNVFLTAITAKGRVVCKSSNGVKKQKKTKKKNVPLSLYNSAVFIAQTLAARGFRGYTLYFTGRFAPVIGTVLKGLGRVRSVKCFRIINVQSVAHNGVRLPFQKKNKKHK